MGRFREMFLLSLDTKFASLGRTSEYLVAVKCHRKSDQWVWSVQKNVRQGEIFLYPCLVIHQLWTYLLYVGIYLCSQG